MSNSPNLNASFENNPQIFSTDWMEEINAIYWLTCSLLPLQFAADFAQRWIVNWLEKRSANYKSKPAMLNSQTSIPSSPSNQSGVQEIVIEDTEGVVVANTADSTSSDKEANTKSQKNSNGSQLESLAVQAEPKTPTIKRRLAQNEGLSLLSMF